MKEVATMAGGCFWCIEAVFQELKGVETVVSGYIGGTTKNPSYEAVCTGRTGHAEAIRVTFDSRIITFREILELFFAFHDPTTLNRQGPDSGTQYRSAIFPATDAQRQTAQDLIAKLTADGVFPDPIVTTIEPDAPFYPADPYHQNYFKRNPYQPYCAALIGPKVAKLRRSYTSMLG